MLKNKQNTIIFLFFSSSIFTLLDQFIKYKIRHSGGFYICNKGISFGLLLNPCFFSFLFGFFVLFIFFYIKYLLKNSSLSPILAISFIFLISGAISNIIDRIYLGCVVDFLYINLPLFPVFNLADILIFTGSFLLIINFSKKI